MANSTGRSRAKTFSQRNYDKTITLTANRTLRAKESGALVIFNSATSLIAALPAPSDGLHFTFLTKIAASSGVGHLVTVGTGPKVYAKASASGAAIVPTLSKGRVNTQATAIVGDILDLWSDGVDWHGFAGGIWAEQA